MNSGSSTLRSAVDPTVVGSPPESNALDLRQIVENQWRESGRVDLVSLLQHYPTVLADRSLLLTLAVEEFRAHRKTAEISDLGKHCSRFREFGASIERSILRQLEAQRYIDDYVDLTNLFAQPKWPQRGEQFGNFLIIEELGVGSIARVYLCSQSDVGDRRVVVKATPYSDIEASVLGRMNHPNITPIYSTGFVEQFELHYICMPFYGRSTLGDLLDIAFEVSTPRGNACFGVASTRWDQDRQHTQDIAARRRAFHIERGTYVDGVLQLAQQIAEALEHGHRQRILHGDLKPSNVLLTSAGVPVLVDFNLSQDFTNARRRCGGTLPYMPPEQLRIVAGMADDGQTQEFNPTTDIFSFGALLYEMLTGVPPVVLPEKSTDSSEIARFLLRKLEDGVLPLAHHNSLVGHRLDSLVRRCLAFDPDKRPPTMAEVRRELRSQSRLIRSLSRRVQVHPALSFVISAIVTCTIGSVLWYVAAQPPAQIVAYERGLNLLSAGNLNEAVVQFDEALRNDQSLSPARFRRGQANLRRGELELAIADFGELALQGDGRSMSLLAYCFNLKLAPVVAIPWYERAQANGIVSMAVYNNLGASYLVTQTTHTRDRQMQLAERHLLDALQLDNTSVTVQFNLVRLALWKARLDSSYNPFSAWQYARAVLKALPNDRAVRMQIAAWYRAVLEYEATRNSASYAADEHAARQIFAALQESLPRLNRHVQAQDGLSDTAEGETLSPSRCYLEP